jgi:hypothetical protein
MSARRTKRPATVRPGKISDALHEKLSAASWKAHELRESEQPRLTGNLNARHIISDFLYSARGVHSTARTFVQERMSGGAVALDLSASIARGLVEECVALPSAASRVGDDPRVLAIRNDKSH